MAHAQDSDSIGVCVRQDNNNRTTRGEERETEISFFFFSENVFLVGEGLTALLNRMTAYREGWRPARLFLLSSSLPGGVRRCSAVQRWTVLYALDSTGQHWHCLWRGGFDGRELFCSSGALRGLVWGVLRHLLWLVTPSQD